MLTETTLEEAMKEYISTRPDKKKQREYTNIYNKWDRLQNTQSYKAAVK